MSNKLFENLPSMTYTLNTGEVVRVKDFFRKVLALSSEEKNISES
mgnify:CR=1 FL=1